MDHGRTDAGVHAFGQIANFKTNSNLPIEKFPIAINSKLKKSIVIKEAEEVDERFHARYNAKQKTYRYIINNSKQGTAIYRDLEFHIPIKLDVKAMKKAVKYFEGEHDFSAFKASGTSSKSSVRVIFKAEVIENEDRIYIELTGNGFLYNMVRIISGTLVDVGLRKNKAKKNTRNYRIKRKNYGRKNSTSTWIISSKCRIPIKIKIAVYSNLNFYLIYFSISFQVSSV